MARTRSLSIPIALGAVTVALSIAMLVAWIVVIVQNNALTAQVAQNAWMLIAGIMSLGIIITVLVLFSVFLVRETLEIRRQDNFIDSVTHELKSPLASIKLCLQTIDRPNLQQEQAQTLRQMMIDDVERLSIFIEDVLQASRLTHGIHAMSFTEVDVATLVHSCVNIICKRYRLEPSRVEVWVPQPLSLHTDRIALETVMTNLLDNAIKYSDSPVRVEVLAQMEGRGISIAVRDFGIGISAVHLKRLSQRFYRVPDPAVRSRRGTGLGLFVVASHVRSLGGRMVARSQGVGKGATFSVWLPQGQKEHT